MFKRTPKSKALQHTGKFEFLNSIPSLAGQVIEILKSGGYPPIGNTEMECITKEQESTLKKWASYHHERPQNGDLSYLVDETGLGEEDISLWWTTTEGNRKIAIIETRCMQLIS